jgi:ADP-ribosylglycohydrolase
MSRAVVATLITAWTILWVFRGQGQRQDAPIMASEFQHWILNRRQGIQERLQKKRAEQRHARRQLERVRGLP